MPKIILSIILLSILLTPCIVLALQPNSEQTQEIVQSPPAWQNIWNWIKEKVLFLWDKIYVLLSKEVEQRKPGVEDEFLKEAEEMKQEIKKEAPSLWQRFLNLIK